MLKYEAGETSRTGSFSRTVNQNMSSAKRNSIQISTLGSKTYFFPQPEQITIPWKNSEAYNNFLFKLVFWSFFMFRMKKWKSLSSGTSPLPSCFTLS